MTCSKQSFLEAEDTCIFLLGYATKQSDCEVNLQDDLGSVEGCDAGATAIYATDDDNGINNDNYSTHATGLGISKQSAMISPIVASNSEFTV